MDKPALAWPQILGRPQTGAALGRRGHWAFALKAVTLGPLPSPPYLPPWSLEAGPPWQKAEGGPVCSQVGSLTLELAQMLPCAENRGPGAGVLFNQHLSRQGLPVSEEIVSCLQKNTTLLAWFP